MLTPTDETDRDAWTAEDPTLCPVCHLEACEDPAHLPSKTTDGADGNCQTAPASTPTPRLTFVSARDLIRTPRPVEIVEGIAWAGRLTVLVAESGAGKTFLLLDQAAAISSAVPWHGRAVLPGSVAYVSFEGDALELRLRALFHTGGHTLDHFHAVHAHDPLSPRVGRDGGEERSLGELDLVAGLEALVAAVAAAHQPPIRLLVIDTVRASLVGSEDNSDSVAAYLRAARRILRCVPEAACLLAHHAGWQDGENPKKRERGSSTWRGNCDATLYLETGAFDKTLGTAPLTLQTLKVRDAEKGDPMHLIRRRVQLLDEVGEVMLDRHGRPLTSCVIEWDRRSREAVVSEQATRLALEHRQIDLQVLRMMHAHPRATSIRALRSYVSLKLDVVADAVARLLRASLVLEGKRGHPYILTAAGLSVVATGVWPAEDAPQKP